ncbi:MAG TPA: hypothetical protein VH559_11805, partial [Gemmatimonadaceae bacterium]
MRRWVLVAGLGLACSKRDVPPPASKATPPATAAAAPTDAAACPQTGAWAECSVVYRLERAGLAPKIDSTAKPAEQALGGTPLMLKIGLSAQLEVHLFPDSAARLAAASKLDRKDFVSGTAPQTIKRERTLIESANLIGLLTSINAHQRERVSDALVAGPPQ